MILPDSCGIENLVKNLLTDVRRDRSSPRHIDGNSTGRTIDILTSKNSKRSVLLHVGIAFDQRPWKFVSHDPLQ